MTGITATEGILVASISHVEIQKNASCYDIFGLKRLYYLKNHAI
jgi:hypothetical protein